MIEGRKIGLESYQPTFQVWFYKRKSSSFKFGSNRA